MVSHKDSTVLVKKQKATRYLLGNYYQIEVKQSTIYNRVFFTTEDTDKVTITQNGTSFRVEPLSERSELRGFRPRSGVLKVAKDFSESLGITLRVRIGKDSDGLGRITSEEKTCMRT